MGKTLVEMQDDGVFGTPLLEAQRKRHLQQSARQTAESMRELIADPRWEQFYREVEEMKVRAEALQKRAEAKLLGGYLSPTEYGNASIALAATTGVASAFKDVLELVDHLIKKGDEAEKELAKSPN